MPEDPEVVLLAYDVQERRPGCVLLAAAMGADTSAAKAFPSELWLTAPTPGLRVYRFSRQQLAIIVRSTTNYHDTDKAD